MYGAPFYSMPFTYPPASSGAQMTTDQATGVAAAVVERKPSDSDGEANHEGDASEPVLRHLFLPFIMFIGRAESLPTGDPAGDVHLGCCLSDPLWHMTWPDIKQDTCSQAPNAEGVGGQEGHKVEAGGEQQPQAQPEGLQYLLPPDATGNNAAALAALLQANQAGGEAAEFWRQRAGQLAGSGVDLTQLAATAAGQQHIPPVSPAQTLACMQPSPKGVSAPAGLMEQQK